MKSVIVTGGTTRLGQEIAAYLRQVGWRVLTTSHRSEAGADIQADLSDPAGAVRLYADAIKLLNGQPPDALVNNAALYRGDSETLRQIHCLSPRKLTRLMSTRETGIGSVVDILDTRVLREEVEDTVYAQTKVELLESIPNDALLFSSSLRVNGVAPGPVLAPTMLHEAAGELPLNRRPKPEEIAQAVHFLLTAEAITGVVLPVDSGQHLLEDAQ